MGHKYIELMFTRTIKEIQNQQGSRKAYEKMASGEDKNFLLSEHEAQFIRDRDSFYMASVSETGWPYIQHRGGPIGFIKVLDARTLAFADFSGNRQYISAGNLSMNNRVALFFMDYPNRRRLKLAGTVSQIDESDFETLASLEQEDYRADVERGFKIHIEGFDWNCPQHITPRYSDINIAELIEPLKRELNDLKRSKEIQYPDSLGNGSLQLVISGIRQLIPNIREYELSHPEGLTLPSVEPGSHIGVPIQLDSGQLVYRDYSLTNPSEPQSSYKIAVKQSKNSDTQSVSRALHKHFSLGLKLNCRAIKNYFPISSGDNPAILIAGGIGITPLKAMAHWFKQKGLLFRFYYVGKKLNEMAYVEDLKKAFGKQIKFYESENKQKLDLKNILDPESKNTHFYICGPQSLIEDAMILAKKAGINHHRIHYEKFQHTPSQDTHSVTLTLSKTKKIIDVPANKSLLDAILESGLEVPYSCRTGVCKSCVVSVVSGAVDHQDSVLTDQEKEDQKLMCPCVSRAIGKNLTIDL